MHEPVASYFSGMRARLGFLVAFEVDPEFSLIDEVLGVGDQGFKEKSVIAIEEKIRSDHTIVLVSHSAKALEALCDRTVWIDRGRVMSMGPTEAVLWQ